MNDRIRLAEAMGWHRTIDTDPEQPLMRRPDEPDGPMQECPNPFTDANDDYAVLEWMISLRPVKPPCIAQDEWSFYAHELNRDVRFGDYKIGDYARTALKVLDNE